MKTRLAILGFALIATAALLVDTRAADTPPADMARPLAEVLDGIKERFDIKLKIRDKTLLENKTLPWADYRIRRYSAEDSLRNVLAPFDLMFEYEGNNVYRIIAYDHPRRTPAEGAAEIRYLTALYNNRQAWEKQARALKPALLEALQLSPMPASPGTTPVLTEVRRMKGYNVQNFALETLPGVFVCGSVYMPANPRGKCPLIITPNGHFPTGRYHKDQQILCATFARMGAYAVSYDLFAYGESLLQFPVAAHRTPMAQTMQILNGLRIMDYFSTLPEVDAARIAVTGASGGGSQTMMLAALDERVACSAPVVMLSARFDGGCPCESGRPIHLAAGGMNNCELAALAAPRPQLIVSDGKDWTNNVPHIEYPFLKYIYWLGENAARVENVHLEKEGHDYGPNKRAAVYAFFAKQLGLAADAINENACEIEPETALYVFGDKGERLPANAVKGMEALEKVFRAAK